jgi:hypothetical protein
MTASEKAPYAALRFILVVAAYGNKYASLLGIARLASGAFCEAVWR